MLEPYAGRSPDRNHGERVVDGQRLMQAASDIFLGWSTDPTLRVDFYVRQMRDCKAATNIDTMDYPHLRRLREALRRGTGVRACEGLRRCRHKWIRRQE